MRSKKTNGPRYPRCTQWSKVSKMYQKIQGIQNVSKGPRYPKVQGIEPSSPSWAVSPSSWHLSRTYRVNWRRKLRQSWREKKISWGLAVSAFASIHHCSNTSVVMRAVLLYMTGSVVCFNSLIVKGVNIGGK